MAAQMTYLTTFCCGVGYYVSLESFISGWWSCLITQLTHKSKYKNDINVVALNVFDCYATVENYIFA